MSLEIGPQIGAARLEQRSDDAIPPRADSAQPAIARAAQEPQEQRLRHIVTGMCGGDERGGELLSGALVGVVTHAVRRGLDRNSPRCRQPCDIGPLDDNRPARLFGQLAAECFVGVGLVAAKAVMDVHESGNAKPGRIRRQPVRRARPFELQQQV